MISHTPPWHICLLSISLTRKSIDRAPAATLNKHWNSILYLRLAIEGRDLRRENGRWESDSAVGRGRYRREKRERERSGIASWDDSLPVFVRLTARYLECQCNAVGRYVINASCRCYRCVVDTIYARGVRVTIADVRSCCCNGILLSARIERDSSWLLDDADAGCGSTRRWSMTTLVFSPRVYNCPAPFRNRRVMCPCVGTTMGVQNERYFSLSCARKMYRFISLGAFTVRANRERNMRNYRVE